MALCSTCNTVWQAQTCNSKVNAHDWTDCWPPRWKSITVDPGVMMGWGLYSPGIACPAGYTTAARATAGGLSRWNVEYSMEKGETAVACCPPGYAITSIVATSTTGQTCVLTVTTSTSFSTVQCDEGSFAGFSLVQIPDDASQYVIYAPLFQLNYKETDLPSTTSLSSSTAPTSSTSASPLPTVFPTASTTLPTASDSTWSNASSTGETSTSGISAGARGTSTGSSPSASGTASSGSSKGRISTGAAIGIGVGVGVGALVLFATAFLLFQARRRRSKKVEGETRPGADEKSQKKLPLTPRAELPGNGVEELEALDEPHELATSPQRRGNTPPPTGLRFRTSQGFPYQQELPVFELEGDSTANMLVRNNRCE